MDDEIIVQLGPSQLSGNEYYSTVSNCEVDIEAKARKLKFYAKYLVWQTIAQGGQVYEP